MDPPVVVHVDVVDVDVGGNLPEEAAEGVPATEHCGMVVEAQEREVVERTGRRRSRPGSFLGLGIAVVAAAADGMVVGDSWSPAH